MTSIRDISAEPEQTATVAQPAAPAQPPAPTSAAATERAATIEPAATERAATTEPAATERADTEQPAAQQLAASTPAPRTPTPDDPARRIVTDLPTAEQIDAERRRLKHGKLYRRALTGTLGVLVVVAAVAVLVATLFLPILQISGTSMEPTLDDGDIIVLSKGAPYQTGDLIAFYYSGKVLIKRVIARPGEFVDIEDDGTVLVNEQAIDEPYITEKSLGDVTIDLPCQVGDSSVFVLGDHRSVSVDSRSEQIGCVSYDDIIGKIVLRVWPLSGFGFVG